MTFLDMMNGILLVEASSASLKVSSVRYEIYRGFASRKHKWKITVVVVTVLF